MSKIGVKFVRGGKEYLVDTATELNVNDNIVVESERGVEIAFVSQLSCENNDLEKIKFVRLATNEDMAKMENLKKNIPSVMSTTKKLIEKYKLEMKLVDVSFTLDGTKVIISYICEDRVDFRELVKDLAYELKLRIELKQIGVRDQAKSLGGIGLCGKECCCKEYLNDFDKVSVKMAKVQGLSLNPTKISGLCGRLMCCLAYENETYMELNAKMPKMNSTVKTPDGIGTVVYNNILKQKVSVKIDNNGDIKINEYDLDQLNSSADIVKPKVEKKTDEQVVKNQNAKEDKSLESKPKEKHYHKNKKKFNKFKKENETKK